MRVRYTPRAFADRERIFSYLEERNPHAAHRVAGLIKQRIGELSDNPYKAPKTDRGDLHALWMKPYPYRIYYRVDSEEEEVVIIHIRHTSRRPWRGS